MAKPASSKNKELLLQPVDFLVAAERAFNIGGKIDMPPIVEFVEHPSLLNRPHFLYPRQKTFLRLVFLELESMTQYDFDVIGRWAEDMERTQGTDEDIVGCSPDVWERVDYLRANGYSHFREVVNILGRRGSKGVLGGIIGGWMNWRLIQAGNPQRHYGIEEGKDLYFYVTATGQSQAIRYQFADLANVLTSGPCFAPYLYDAKPTYVSLRTDADAQRAADLLARGIHLDRPIASIINMAISANSQAARGGAGFGVIFDELAHMLTGTEGPRTADAVYKALTPSLAQFGQDAFIYAPTSPYQQIGRAYTLYQDGLAKDDDGHPLVPYMLVMQLPSWGLYEDWDDPTIVNVPFVSDPAALPDSPILAMEKRRDPESFRVEYESQWSSVVAAWMSAKTVEKIFQPVYDIELGIERYAEENLVGAPAWVYRGHADPGWASDNFATAIGHTEPIFDPETGDTWHHVFIDWMRVWKPEDFEDHHVDYIQVEEELADAICRYPTLQTFSFDQYSAMVTLTQMRAKLVQRRHRARVIEETATAKSNRRRAEVFKAAVNQGWVHSYRDEYGLDGASLLELECKFLQVRGNRIDHQRIGPVTTKDLFDAVSVVVEGLVGDQLEKLRRREQLGSLPLAVGAQGGYHTQGAPAEDLGGGSATRRNLDAWSRRSMNRYGLTSTGKQGYPGSHKPYVPWGQPR